MTRVIQVICLLFILCAVAFPQSGRGKKKAEKDAKKPAKQGAYVPTQTLKPGPTPTPAVSPTPRPKREGDVINIDSTLVPIPVSVVDQRSGKAVTTLKISDFKLRIDGKPVTVNEMFRSESPVRLALLFDNSSSVTIAREFEQEAAIKFFRRVIRPRIDLAALFSVAAVSRLEQELTRNVSSLVRAIKDLPQPQGATALHDAIVKASDYLVEYGGRRVIVIVSDGQDTLSDTAFDEMVKIVQKNNCQVYVVHTNDFENLKRTGDRAGSANLRALAAERRMQNLALQTGGAVYSPIDKKELDRAFSQISAELSNQYIIGYYPENETRDDRFRSIELTVVSEKALRIRSRKGYYVQKR